ncbi:MAG: dinitrogenase iron-molybdenum cofactor biosynthesis protein [Geobacteraceae bacterium]|nr:dinitrogenase iron-molybdenum cofactor biosynthesis protein [Geobacteraceae bacterium]
MVFAVASRDGREINQHFGHAERFLIFEVRGADVSCIDERKVERYCSYDEEHPLRGHVLRAIAEALDGCAAIVCSQIGTAPREEMSRLGFEVYCASGEIRPTLLELARLL